MARPIGDAMKYPKLFIPYPVWFATTTNWVLLCPEGVPMRLSVGSVVDKRYIHTHTYIFIYRNVSWYSISKMFYFIGNALHIEHNKRDIKTSDEYRNLQLGRLTDKILIITSVVVVIQWKLLHKGTLCAQHNVDIYPVQWQMESNELIDMKPPHGRWPQRFPSEMQH